MPIPDWRRKMQRFTLKRWSTVFEELIIEATDIDDAYEMADNYPEVEMPVEVVKEVESLDRTEVTPIEEGNDA